MKDGGYVSKPCEGHQHIDLDGPKMDWVVDQLFADPAETDGRQTFDVWVGPVE
ncbi:hypothetical protein OKN36_16690 [Furfurilactobacillus sp. OKN36]